MKSLRYDIYNRAHKQAYDQVCLQVSREIRTIIGQLVYSKIVNGVADQLWNEVYEQIKGEANEKS